LAGGGSVANQAALFFILTAEIVAIKVATFKSGWCSHSTLLNSKKPNLIKGRPFTQTLHREEDYQ